MFQTNFSPPPRYGLGFWILNDFWTFFSLIYFGIFVAILIATLIEIRRHPRSNEL